MRPTTIPKTPKGRWVGHHAPAHFAAEHYATPSEAAVALAEIEAMAWGSVVTVGPVYSSEEDILDGHTFAGLILDHIYEAVQKVNPTKAETWAKWGPFDRLKGASDAFALKLRGATMAYLIEAESFPPPWYSAPERFFRVLMMGPKELRELCEAKKIRGAIPERLVDEIPEGSFAVRELEAGPGAPEGWKAKGTLFPCHDLAAFLGKLIGNPNTCWYAPTGKKVWSLAEWTKFVRDSDLVPDELGRWPMEQIPAPDLPRAIEEARATLESIEEAAGSDPGLCSACPTGANYAKVPAVAVRVVENPIGVGKTELGLCEAHALDFDEGEPIRWIGPPKVRNLPGHGEGDS